MMFEQNTKAFADLQSLAAKKNIAIPTTITQKGEDEYNKLNEKSGKDFDKKYCDMMVDGHKDAISKFEKEASDGVDADIKTWASETLTTLRTHLEHSTNCQKVCEKK